jgi:membrane dipeptidase
LLITNLIMKNLISSLSLFSLLFLLINACSSDAQQQPEELSVEEKALQLSQNYIITDGHIDLPYRMKIANFRLEREYVDPSVETDGDFDYVKAKAGGLDAPFMSIYIPASYQSDFDHEYGRFKEGEKNRAKGLADSLITMVEEITEKYPDKFALATSPDDIEKQFEQGLVSLPMGMENGAPIGDQLSNVQYFYDRGIRYITLTHSKVNQISDSSYDSVRVWNGLSPFGEEVVKEMNRVGIMVDISHVSDSTFYDVLQITEAPVIASHSSVRKFVPGFERNMNDDMIKALGENGGVIQINFGSTFVDADSREKSTAVRAHLSEWMKENNLSFQDSAAQAYMEQYMKENPMYSTVSKVADHIDHVVSLVGVDHVAFGSDFDGVGDTLPTGLKDASEYPNLIAELLKRGYSEEDIEKICYKNVFRVWREVEKVAQELS